MGQPVVHFEIGGKDGKKLRSFYAKNFGWKINAKNPMNYGVVDTAAQGKSRGIGGGVFETMPEQPPRVVTVYIEVKKIDSVLKKIEKAGGKTVMARTVLPGMVTFAQFTDPAGNLIGLVESDMPPAEAASRGAKKAGKKAKAKKAKAKKASKKAKAKKAAPKQAKAKKAAKKPAPKQAAVKKTKGKTKKVAPKKARSKVASPKKPGAKTTKPKSAATKKAKPRKAPPKELAAPEAMPVDVAPSQPESSWSEDMTQA